MDIWKEPPRGSLWPRWMFALSGVERLLAAQRLHVAPPPSYHLFGLTASQIGAGSVTYTLPRNEWLLGPRRMIDLDFLIDRALTGAALTTVGPGMTAELRTATINYARPATIDSAPLVARARVLNSRRSLAVCEVVVEDASGRFLSHAVGQAAIKAVEGPFPPVPLLEPVEAPAHSTPDPWRRPWTGTRNIPAAGRPRPGIEILREAIAHEHQPSTVPVQSLLGMVLTEIEEGSAHLEMPATGWLACHMSGAVIPGAILHMISGASATAGMSIVPPDTRLAALHSHATFTTHIAADGELIRARGVVIHRDDIGMIATAEVTDASGQVVARGGATFLTVGAPTEPLVEPERALATILFTDIVSSTEHASELGDGRWASVLEEHNRIAREAIERDRGREVKQTGDGFLVAFDSPARALRCAQSIGEAVRGLGIEIRAGIHTGECEILGADLGGIAVHIASRAMAEAAPGEIVVTGTVRDLVAGSGMSFEERATKELRGVPGTWTLLAVKRR